MPEGSTDEMPEGSSGAACSSGPRCSFVECVRCVALYDNAVADVPKIRKRRRGQLDMLQSNSPLKGRIGQRDQSTRSERSQTRMSEEPSAVRERKPPENLGERVVSSPTKRRTGSAGEAHWRHDDERMNASVQSATNALSILGPERRRIAMMRSTDVEEIVEGKSGWVWKETYHTPLVRVCVCSFMCVCVCCF
jgi:hypothetical protein